MARRDVYTQKDRDREAKEAAFKEGVTFFVIGICICGWFPWFGGLLVVAGIGRIAWTLLIA